MFLKKVLQLFPHSISGQVFQFLKELSPNLCQKNTEVSILKEQNGWYNVVVTFCGWVSKNYIHDIE